MLPVVLSVLFCLCWGTSYADYINGVVYGAETMLAEDVLIADKGALYIDNVYIRNNIYMQNDGVVDSKYFYLCDYCQFYLENTGRFDVDFILGQNNKIFHVLRDADNIKDVDFNVAHFLLIQDSKPLSWNSVSGVVGNASQIVLENATLVMDSLVLNPVPMVLNGENVLVADDFNPFYNRPVFTNVSGDGRVRIQTNNINPLYANVVYVTNNNLYVRLERVTDYATILGDGVGRYLNDLRLKNPTDSLLVALDKAGDMRDLRKIMTRSVRLNPIRLMQPVRTIANFNKSGFGMSELFDGGHSDIIISNNSEYYGADVGIVFRTRDMNLDLRLNTGVLDYADDIDNFAADIYGVRFGGIWSLNPDSHIRAFVGGMLANFTSGELFDGRDIISNPRGVVVYGVAEYVHNFDMLSPFVGIDFDYMSVANDSENNITGRGGIDMRYTYEMLGLKYEYAVRVGMRTDENLFAEIRAGFMSIVDQMGGNITFGVSRDDDITSYKVGIGVDLLF